MTPLGEQMAEGMSGLLAGTTPYRAVTMREILEGLPRWQLKEITRDTAKMIRAERMRRRRVKRKTK